MSVFPIVFEKYRIFTVLPIEVSYSHTILANPAYISRIFLENHESCINYRNADVSPLDETLSFFFFGSLPFFFMLLPAIFWSSAKVVTRLSSYPYLLLAACMHASALQSRCRAARASACGRSFLDGCWPSYSHTLVPLPPFFSIPHPRALQCLRLCIVNR